MHLTQLPVSDRRGAILVLVAALGVAVAGVQLVRGDRALLELIRPS